MTPRARLRTALTTGSLLIGAVVGCDGSSPSEILDGGIERPRTGQQGGSGGSSTGGTSGTFDAGQIEVISNRPPPMVNPMARRIVAGRARLVGTHGSACSNQTTGGSAERWCAFSQPGASLGTTELWVMNVSKAMTGVDVKCDGTDPNCKRLTTRLWTEQPPAGPFHPTAHRFDGDTLIYHAEVQAASVGDIYRGPIFAWRPGWESAKRISGTQAVTCSAHFSAQAAVCIENLTPDTVMPLQFDLTAGKIDGNEQLKKVGLITPSRANDATQWRSGFTREGDYFLWSTGGATLAERETLFVVKTDEIGQADKVRMFDVGVTRWNLSIDGQKLYYYRNYNYSVENDPSGTLTMADFPGNPAGGPQNEVPLAARVGAYQLLFDGTENDRGLAFFDMVTLGKGNYKIMRDRANPMQVTSVVQSISGALVSRDMRFAYYSRDFDEVEGTSDAWITKTDGSGTMCALTTTLQSDLYGSPFLPNGNLVFWVDRINLDLGVGEGWVGNPDGCKDKRKFSDGMDFWFLAGSEGILFSDSGDGETATLRYAAITNGTTLGQVERVQEQVERIYAILPNFNAVVYQISRNSTAVDGLYLYTNLPFAGVGTRDGGAPSPMTDAGAPAAEAGTPDAGAPDAATD